MKEYVPFDPNYWFSLTGGWKHTSVQKKIDSSELEKALKRITQDEPIKPALKTVSHSQSGDLLESILEARGAFLSQEIGKLKELQGRRIDLSQSIQESIEYALTYHKNIIYELDLWPRGSNSAVEKRRIHLERIRDGLNQEKRREAVSVWKDVFSVNRDLRMVMKEYVELMVRKRLILE